MNQNLGADYPAPAHPAREKPVVTYSLLGLTIAVFLLQLGTRSFFGYDLPAIYGAKVNELIEIGQIWRLFTPMLLHSTSFLMHIVFNMYALYSFGPGLEQTYGHSRFLTLYLLAGFSGNVLSFMFSPNPSLGASTAVFGLVGAEAVFLYQNRKLLGGRAQGALMNLLLIVVLNLFLGFSSGFTDNWGHIGGLVGGVMYAWFGGPLLDFQGLWGGFQLAVVDRRKGWYPYAVALVIFALFAILAGITIFQRVGA